MRNSTEFYKTIIDKMPIHFSQKEFALEVIDKTPQILRGPIFALHQNKDITDSIWALLRPEHEKPFEKL
jgi:hypothetical protein